MQPGDQTRPRPDILQAQIFSDMLPNIFLQFFVKIVFVFDKSLPLFKNQLNQCHMWKGICDSSFLQPTKLPVGALSLK